MSAFTQQRLEWHACDRAFVGEKLWERHEGDFEALGDRAQCALMRAPLDYSRPQLGELQVALSRVAAAQPQQRQGAIFFNPGGPGVDGLGLGAFFGRHWSTADPGNPVSPQFKQMSERYDLIGFSPRGLGAGTRLKCDGSAMDVEAFLLPDGNLVDVLDPQTAMRLLAQACSAEPLSKHVHTDAIARDMDLMRGLLGDEKLNYIGYSYGAWIGSWYASLYPAHVGRMRLDSSLNVFEGIEKTFASQDMARQRLLDEIFLPYATRHPQLFDLGKSVAELRSALAALSPELSELLFSSDFDKGNSKTIHWSWSDSRRIDLNLVYMKAALELQSLLRQHSAADKGQILAAVAAHRFAPDPGINELAVELAQQLATRLFEAPDGSSEDFSDELSSMAVKLSVVCNDSDASGNTHRNAAAASPSMCSHWPHPRIQRPPLAMIRQAGPILMLQSRHDALTPIDGAQATLDALPQASVIVVENEFQHGVFPYGEQCVDAQVASYFLHGTMPPRQSSCAGKPLRFDAEPYRVAADGNRDGNP
ncbi:alpha/beta hydrolase [Comamonas endophytica]|uniref:Alpha/beta hydrolase n=1 Tax=Comamonas endophytica TaxID=2949090 RepID=A0ABY6G8C4_9BURK|nr:MULTISPECIES: alpha/beta hydrolase [unclassified Acidovorax]MCD2514139.1 alpha/beta hydrolase [Acidovorax sp. D4N7]UYG51279.1 alpha/beta hydrolase [Acidovorax sp. 5MLIR]